MAPLQQGLGLLNCFAGNRFHPLRFAVLLLLVLLVVFAVREYPVYAAALQAEAGAGQRSPAALVREKLTATFDEALAKGRALLQEAIPK